MCITGDTTIIQTTSSHTVVSRILVLCLQTHEIFSVLLGQYVEANSVKLEADLFINATECQSVSVYVFVHMRVYLNSYGLLHEGFFTRLTKQKVGPAVCLWKSYPVAWHSGIWSWNMGVVVGQCLYAAPPNPSLPPSPPQSPTTIFPPGPHSAFNMRVNRPKHANEE